jgi:hypothetical protein
MFKQKFKTNYLFGNNTHVRTQSKVGILNKVMRDLIHNWDELIHKQVGRRKLGEIRRTVTHALSDNWPKNKTWNNFILFNNNSCKLNTTEVMFETVEFWIFKEIERFKYKFKKWILDGRIERKFKIRKRLEFDKRKFKLKIEKAMNLSNSFDAFIYDARDVVDTNRIPITLRVNKKFEININDDLYYKTRLVDDDKLR